MSLFDESVRRDPFPLYARLRDDHPVFHDEAHGLWIVSRHASVRRVLTDHEVFSSRVSPLRGHGFEWLLFMDPPRHTELRALINRAFTSRSIAELEPRIAAIVEDLVGRLADGDDLVAALCEPLPLRVIAEIIGLPVADAPRLARWGNAIIELGNTIGGADAARASSAFVEADAEMASYFAAVVAERRVRPVDDLVSRLAAAELGELELVRFCQLLLAAGTETTTNLIANAVVCFADHPDQLAAARTSWPVAIEEVLRYRTPVQAMFRATRGAVDLDGVTLPADAFVIASLGAANRDPRAFAAPDRFDVTRAPNPHLAFGHGIHFCLGAPLARLEARLALGSLYQRFARILPLAAWTPRRAFHVHGPAALHARLEP